MIDERPDIYFVFTVMQAELLAAITAFGGSPMHLDRKRSVPLRVVAENVEAAALGSITPTPVSGTVVVHPFAEHPTSASPAVHALHGHQPDTAVTRRCNSGFLP